MHTTMSAAEQDRIFSEIISALCALLFGGGSAYVLGYAMARKAKVKGSRLYVFSVALGLFVAAVLMWLLGNVGTEYAFCALVGVFFGALRGGQINRRGRRRRPPGMPPRELYPTQESGGNARRR